MPRPLKVGILGASTIILSKDIDKHAFMCGSNFNETDVNSQSEPLVIWSKNQKYLTLKIDFIEKKKWMPQETYCYLKYTKLDSQNMCTYVHIKSIHGQFIVYEK